MLANNKLWWLPILVKVLGCKQWKLTVGNLRSIWVNEAWLIGILGEWQVEGHSKLMEDQAREVNRGSSGGPPAGDRKLNSNSSVARTGWAALHWHNHIRSYCCLQPLCCWILSKNCPLPACNKSLQNLASNNESSLISLGVCWGGIWEELSWAFLVWDLSHGCCCVLAGLPSSEVWTGLKYPLPGWLTLLANKLVVGWGP